MKNSSMLKYDRFGSVGMFYADYHIHSLYSFDSLADLNDICQYALCANLKEIALTDHLDLHYPCGKWNQHYLLHEKEREIAVKEMRDKYQGALHIRYGLELGQPTRDYRFLQDFLSTRQFDFILGSIHYTTDEREILALPFNDLKTANEILVEYFENVLQMLECDQFDVIAHICHPLRVMENVFEKPSLLQYAGYIESILKKLIEKGKGLEVSTKGMRYWLHSLEPQPEFLRMYYQLGGELITVGTDSHEADTVGSYIADAYEYIKQAGFRYITTYINHQPIQHKI